MQKNKVYSLIDKAVFDYKLIEDGDKILLGVSGGKDSTLLAQYLSHRLKRRGEHFQFTALNIASNLSGGVPQKIIDLFNDWGVDYKCISIDLVSRLKAGEKVSCYWCSLNRRMELNNYAMANGYNKLALAHHTDDVLETLLMNALDKCTLSTMIPKLHYNKYPVEIIRPLYYVTEDKIIAYAKKSGWLSSVCTCCYQSHSSRKVARARLNALTAGDSTQKMHLLNALSNVLPDYLPNKAIPTK